MLKIYEIWRESGMDPEEADNAYLLAFYTNRKSAEEHLAWIEKKIRECSQAYGPYTITEYVPGDHICGNGSGGCYDRWSIEETDVRDEFTPTDHTSY